MGHRGRLWALRLISALAAPLFVLAAAEGILRLAGVGYDPSFTVACEVEGRDSVCDNRKFAWRFFPPRIARSAPSFSYPAKKGERTYRIFVLGASAAQGDPEPPYSFSRILEVLLRDRHPAVRFEVVNTGITAVNSHVVLPIARETARHDPDLFIVYLGNNEVVGPFGPGTIFSPMSRSLLLIRASVRARGTRLGQVLARLFERSVGANTPEEWQGMEMFLGKHVRRDDPRLARAYSHFERNLEEIVAAGSRSGAEVILGTVVTNLRDCAPFASLGRDDLDDDRRADLHYRLGKLRWAEGAYSEAANHLVAARDLDVLRFRADSRINEIIRAVAASEGAVLFDAERLFETRSPDGIPGSELFLEHVHPSFAGNYLLAVGLLTEIETGLPDWAKAAPAAGVLSEEECQARLAYTAHDRQRMLTELRRRLGRPPFTNQSDHGEQVARIERELADLVPLTTPSALAAADERYRDAIRGAPDDPWLRYNHGALLTSMGRPGEAAAAYRAFLAHLPHDVPGREKLSAALTEAGRFEEAVAECRKLIEAEPGFAPPYRTMAYALARLGRFDESIDTYRRLLAVDPSSWDDIYNEIGRIQVHAGRLEEAIATFREAIARNTGPDERAIPDLHYNHAFALKKSGHEAEARRAFGRAAESYREQLAANADSTALHLALASSLIELEEYAEASREFGEAARLDPGSYTAHSGLAVSLERSGRREEAREACRRGIRVLQDAGRVEEADRLRRRLEDIERAGGTR